MSATFVTEAMVMAATESQPPLSSAKVSAQMDIEFAKCDCCGLTEECTPAYIERIRKRYQGKWICGLCGEAVKDEIVRCERLLSTEDALARHMNFCSKFRSSGPPPNPAVHLISAMRQILRRSMDSPRSLRSMPSSPTKGGRGMMKGASLISRSESCIPALTLVDSASFDSVVEEVSDDQ